MDGIADRLLQEYENGGRIFISSPECLLKPVNFSSKEEFLNNLTKEELIEYVKFLKLKRKSEKETVMAFYYYAKGLEGR